MGRLIKLLLVLALLWALIAFALSGAGDRLFRAARMRELDATLTLPPSRTSILLMGVDKSKGGASRADSIIIASVGLDGSVRLTSVMRDTLVSIDGHENRQKLNAAYAYGGADLMMKTVNQTFGLNITRYAAIGFQGFADVVDALGGVEVSVTQAEMKAMNETAKPRYALNQYGENVHLTGPQALRFARLRKLDSDYMRASRQRRVLEAALEKVRSLRNPLGVIRGAQAALSCVTTNMSPLEIAAFATRALVSGKMESFRVPADGAYESGTKDGVWSIRPDYEKNQTLLHDFIYG